MYIFRVPLPYPCCRSNWTLDSFHNFNVWGAVGQLTHTSFSNLNANTENFQVTRLEAEPQDGPTEYKLHLLLRPRRNYSSSSTGHVVSGSQQHKQQPANQQPFLND